MNRNRMMFYLLMATTAGICLLQAGSLEPPGSPAPTMTSLDYLPATMHRILSLGRFEVVMNGAAVLDHETGLVWQRSIFFTTVPWKEAVRDCRALSLGRRYGWRLPSVEEMATLIDPDQSTPALPPLHPFFSGGLTLANEYWTSSTSTLNTDKAWTVDLDGNGSLKNDKVRTISGSPDSLLKWCVRGSVGLDTGRP